MNKEQGIMIESTASSKITGDLINLYQQNYDKLATGASPALNIHRAEAFQHFRKLGIPGAKDENYRYTPLESYFKGDYQLELVANKSRIDIKTIFQCDVPELDTHVILVLNGFYSTQTRAGKLPDGIIICGLNEASVQYPKLFRKHYARYVNTSTDGLVALNTLFAQDGVFIYIPANTVVDRPLQIINLSHSSADLRITRRNLIVAEDHATVNVVMCDHTLCNKSFLTNTLTEIYTGKHAVVNLDRLQNENSLSVQINHIFVHQQAGSLFTCNSISLHGGLIRNNFYSTLTGPESQTNLNGLFLGDDHQHVANFTLVDHSSAHCSSNQLFKGILNEKATGSFNGKILVRKDAQKTQAYQKNNTMLLTSESRMHTKPHLEIYADDVKCSHGATVGQLDQEAMFYLRSRGIGHQEARHLLMYAFANEIISRISVSVLKDRIIELVEKRLRGELSRCNHCRVHCG